MFPKSSSVIDNGLRWVCLKIGYLHLGGISHFPSEQMAMWFQNLDGCAWPGLAQNELSKPVLPPGNVDSWPSMWNIIQWMEWSCPQDLQTMLDHDTSFLVSTCLETLY